jgi:hypothetical protein
MLVESITQTGFFWNQAVDLLTKSSAESNQHSNNLAGVIAEMTQAQAKIVAAENKHLKTAYNLIAVLLILLIVSWGYIFPYMFYHRP